MSDSEVKLSELKAVLAAFEAHPVAGDIRERVLALVPVVDSLRELGKSLLPAGLQMGARDRIIEYFRRYPGMVIAEKEIIVVAGISEWARRVRELRVQFGWKIVTGVTVRAMLEAEADADSTLEELRGMKSNEYMLLDRNQDLEAAYRWNLANEIRKGAGGGKSKILEFLRRNVGKPTTGEELSYVANNSSEWARRVRELRTEDGWPLVTRFSGNPELPVGVYVLEADHQAPPHDRKIPDPVRREALRRDYYTCVECGWSHKIWNRADPRFLELHHKQHHAKGGSNDLDNLVTLCNVCHDEVHRREQTRDN